MEKRKNRIINILVIIVAVAGLIMLVINMIKMYEYVQHQADLQGETQLSKVSNEMQHTLDKSNNTLLRFAADVEVYIATGADEEELRSYLKSQSNIFRDQSENTLMNAFICTSEWIVISDSPLPDGYVITERGWYSETLNNGIDNIYTTPPYLDAFTGKMCYTTSLLLSDGKTIIALDFNLSRIQKSVSQMNRSENGEALIISRDGTIVGYSGGELAGMKLKDALPEYNSVYNHLIKEERDSLMLDTSINGKACKSFCNRSGEWFYVYTLESDILYSQTRTIMLVNFVPRIVFILMLTALLVYARKRYNRAEYTLAAAAAAPQQAEDIKATEITAAAGRMTGSVKKSRNSIMITMAITILVAVVFTGFVLINWGSDRIERGIDSYSNQLERWMNTQLQTLNMFVDTISANPSVLDDYDYAVNYLDTIVKHYPEISAAYIARPGNEHEMTMNNGWVPNADYIVAERQWYVDTQNSDTGMSVSSPYLDARTGLYCVTFSRVVLDSRTGLQIGIFALDFYIGNLTGIMEESYSDSGYAFLVDNSNLIVNHPNEEYQMSSEKSVNLAGTEYSDLIRNPVIHFITDYDGRLKVCISRTEEVTGFSVIAVKDFRSIYGVVIMCGGIFIILLVICIILLYNLIFKMIKWQEKTRLALIEEARRASQADHAKSSFLAQMSHEIRTPINAVLGMNEMILRESKEENTLSYAANAYNAGNALLSIINDVLDISKIEAGRLEIVESEYDLYSLVSDCYNMTLNRAEKKGLTLTVSCDETLPARLKGDSFHIRQIIVNFITNAIKYTDSGSVKVSFSAGGGEGFSLCVSVKDTGIGLKPESLEKLFTSFQRFDLERNQSVEGTGLGLAISKQLAELMGGSVGAESVYGEGSTFTCTIPQTVVNGEPIGELHLDRPMNKIDVGIKDMFIAPEARILIVDDVEMNIVVLENFLKQHEMQIDSASGGRECLELVKNNAYDIIFMDHMMPEMDGIETFEKMREMNYIDPKTKVVMLTANAVSGEEEKYLAIGFDSYLTKPVRSDKLEKTLLDFLPEGKITRRKMTADQIPAAQSRSAQSGNDMFDISVGLKYNGEDMETYLTVLGMYVKNGPEKLEQIRVLAENEAWKDYVTEVHALKSTSLMVGSKTLSDAAKELEAAGKEGSYGVIREKNGEMLALYDKIISIGRDVLQREGLLGEKDEGGIDESALTETTEEALNKFVDDIVTACDNFDDDEIDRICDEAAGYSLGGVPLSPFFRKIKAAADDFEYEEASNKAKAIPEQIAEKRASENK